jgi:hypothetical protein
MKYLISYQFIVVLIAKVKFQLSNGLTEIDMNKTENCTVLVPYRTPEQWAVNISYFKRLYLKHHQNKDIWRQSKIFYKFQRSLC